MEAVIKSAASAASPEGFASRLRCIHRFGPPGAKSVYIVGEDLAAVIKSAASAASRNPRGAHGRRPGKRTMAGGWAPLGFLEAVLAADLITAARSLPGRLR